MDVGMTNADTKTEYITPTQAQASAFNGTVAYPDMIVGLQMRPEDTQTFSHNLMSTADAVVAV